MKMFFLILGLFITHVYCQDTLLWEEHPLIKTIKGASTIVYSVAVSPDAKYLAAGGASNTLKIWRLEDGARVKTLTGHTSFVNSVVYSPDGKNLASTSDDGTVKLWSVERGACLQTLKWYKDFVLSAAFFPDGKRIASAGSDGMIRLWRVDSKEPYKTLKGDSGYVYSVSVSSDGKLIASGGMDRIIKIWDAETGGRKLALEGHTDTVNSVSFSPKGDYLASGSEDGSVKVWRFSDGMCVKDFTVGRPVLSVAFSHDGTFVFSGSGDGAVAGWRVAQGAMFPVRFKGHGGIVKTVAASPDGKFLASGSFDKTIKIWRTPWEEEKQNREIQAANRLEREIDINYSKHYSVGLLALSMPTIVNLEKASSEFKLALSYKKTDECEGKLKEAANTLHLKQLEAAKTLESSKQEQLKARRRQALMLKQKAKAVLGYSAILAALLLIVRSVQRMKKKATFRKAFPGEIKMAVALGDYAELFERYMEYRAIGGIPGDLPQEDLLRLYHGSGVADKLPKENIPHSFLLSYAGRFANSGNYKTALHMLRSGQLLDELKKPEEYDAFADIFEKAGKPDTLLMRKFKPDAYSGLAEAFFRIKDYASCKKVCDFKKQFHPSKVSQRDNELSSLAQTGGKPGREGDVVS